jgi:hypothetical protein
MRKSAIVTGMTALGVTASLTLTAVPAQAASQIPGPQQTCSAGQPKLDYEYIYETDSSNSYTWSNVCGTGTWTWNDAGPGDYPYFLYAIRMPTSPYHRIWLHQYANGSGATACFYSTGNDVYIPSIPTWETQPGNVQVSANTSPC